MRELAHKMKFDFLKFLEDTGIEYKYLINGFVGALIWSIYKKLRFTEALRQIIIGSAVAGYITPLVAYKEAIPIEYMAALSFVIGMMGMVIIDSIYKYIYNRVKEMRKGKEVIFKEEQNITESED
jgi:uncharacterized membrane protein YeaQ/YmgE (transglycosylase-associated protein family)